MEYPLPVASPKAITIWQDALADARLPGTGTAHFDFLEAQDLGTAGAGESDGLGVHAAARTGLRGETWRLGVNPFCASVSSTLV